MGAALVKIARIYKLDFSPWYEKCMFVYHDLNAAINILRRGLA